MSISSPSEIKQELAPIIPLLPDEATSSHPRFMYLALSTLQLLMIPSVLIAKVCLFASSIFSKKPDPESSHLHQKLSDYMIKKIHLSEEEVSLLIQILDDSLSETEKFVVLDVLAIIKSPELIRHVFHGANIRVEDSGALYTRWKSLEGIKTRPSSHNHAKGYGKSLHHPIFKEFFFWKDKSTGNTHFQLERHMLRLSAFALCHTILHCFDYITVKKENLQMGPMGRSPFIDSSPIIFTFNASTFESNRSLLKEKYLASND